MTNPTTRSILVLLLLLINPGEIPLILGALYLIFVDFWFIGVLLQVMVLSISNCQYFCLCITWPFKQRNGSAEGVPAL